MILKVKGRWEGCLTNSLTKGQRLNGSHKMVTKNLGSLSQRQTILQISGTKQTTASNNKLIEEVKFISVTPSQQCIEMLELEAVFLWLQSFSSLPYTLLPPLCPAVQRPSSGLPPYPTWRALPVLPLLSAKLLPVGGGGSLLTRPGNSYPGPLAWAWCSQ